MLLCSQCCVVSVDCVLYERLFVVVVVVIVIVVFVVVVVLIVYCIRSSGEYTVKTIAGNGDKGHVDGEGSQAQFNKPWGISTDMNNNIIVGAYGNHCIRMIVFNK